ncbi:MAG: hypothetical protein ACI9KE_004139 [Polyangiales bacterium]|jgi:hypothetical protein
MLKRLLIGVIKGLVIGAALGSAFHFGLGWTTTAGLFAYLLAMGSGATAGVLAGKPPWRQQAWIESVLKSVAGLGVGALAYWGASSWLAVPLPVDIPGIASGTPWTEMTLGITTATAAVFGALVELDNTDDASSGKTKRNVRVSADEAEEVEVSASGKKERTRSA